MGKQKLVFKHATESDIHQIVRVYARIQGEGLSPLSVATGSVAIACPIVAGPLVVYNHRGSPRTFSSPGSLIGSSSESLHGKAAIDEVQNLFDQVEWQSGLHSTHLQHRPLQVAYSPATVGVPQLVHPAVTTRYASSSGLSSASRASTHGL